MSISGILFTHHFLGIKKMRFQLDRWILIGGGLLILLVMLAPLFSATLAFTHLWNGLAVSGGGYVFALILLHAYKKKDNVSYVLGLSGGIILTLATYDLMVTYNLRPLYDGFYLQYSAPFFLIALAWVMLQRFIASLNQTERSTTDLLRLNKELEDRVKKRGVFIEKSYKTIFELEHKQALIKERARIMRDMHDGIGVYLNCILRQLDHKQLDRGYLKESAHRALDDLRLMIDSLGSVSGNLSAMLGMFRTRMGPALEACNITLEWRVDELPELSQFGPERALNLLRILQETITNSIKHSNAHILSLSAYVGMNDKDAECIIIKVRDNGRGFILNASEGNGLFNMSLRAKKINAELNVNSDDIGTCVTIIFLLHEVSSFE